MVLTEESFQVRMQQCQVIGEEVMSWKKPRIVEISLGAEINGYACAAVDLATS
jgi:coenzyme PQQ precursor peptide PqqA